MLKIGLTGGIGTGKSTVSRMLIASGFKVLDADLVARQVLIQYPEILDKVRIEFGEGFFDWRGEFRRKEFGNHIFRFPKLRVKYENIIIPYIKKEINLAFERYEQNGVSLVILDAPTLIENNLHEDMDYVILVWADNTTQVQRVKTRDKLSNNDAISRINAQMPIEEKKKYANILIDNNGELVKTEMYSIGSGGIRSSFNQSYKTEGMVKEFTLVSDNKDVISISLVEEDKLYKYSDVGGNSKDSGIMIGGNKYIFEENTYISLWNKEDINIQSNIFYPKDYFSISDDKGKAYNVNSSNYSGQGNEFVIGGEVKSNLNININRVEVDYNLVNMPKIKVKIPEKGETIEVNKEIYLEDIDEKILLKSIKGTEESVELYFDVHKFKKEDSQIFLLNANFRNHGCSGSADGSPIIMNFDYEDLKLSERITGRLDFQIGGVDLYKDGDWNFKIR